MVIKLLILHHIFTNYGHLMFLNSTHKFFTLLGALFLCSSATYAQDSLKVVRQKAYIPRHTANSNKTMFRKFEFKMDSLILRQREWQYRESDLLANPYYFALMGGPTLNTAAIRNKMGYTPFNAESTTARKKSSLISSQYVYDIVNATDNYLIDSYAETPWLVRFNEVKEGTMNVEQEIKEGVHSETTLTERFTDELNETTLDILPNDDLDIIVRKPNFWTIKTNFSFQFTQNYVSDNWYKGGESHNSLLASMLLDMNYDNKRRLTFDNRLEMKLGFQTSHDDQKHKFKTNSDLLRLTNKLGYCAVHDWYYTLMLQSWTQFYKGYKPNDPKIYSDFMAPFVSLLSLGMDYKKTSKNKKFNITATISPIALKFQFVKFSDLVTSFGHEPGHKVKWEYGSNITVTHSWNIWKNISWAGRFYFFSDYSKAQIEWENTFNFTINKYLSTRLFLYPRFDDAVARKEGMSYFQFNELLSLGLNFNF